MGPSIKNGVMNDDQLALISTSVFDIGKRTRDLMLIFGLLGIALVVMGMGIEWLFATLNG